MRYIKLIPRPRLLGRLVFVVALTALLTPLTTSTVQAAVLPADSNTASCVHITNGGAGSVTVGDVLTWKCNYGSANFAATQPATLTTRITTAYQYGSSVGNTTWNHNTNSGLGSSVGRLNYVPSSLVFTGNSFVYSMTVAALPTSTTFRYGFCDGYSLDACNKGSSWGTQNPPMGAVAAMGAMVIGEAFTFSTLASSEPPNTYGVANRCESVQIGVEVDGAALTVADYDDVLYPPTSSSAQDDFVFVATFNDHNVITDPAGMSLEYQWPNTGWLPITEILDKVALNGGVDSAMSFRLGSGADRYLSQVQFRCRDLTDSDDLTNRRHLAFWAPGASVTTPNWTLGASFLSACRSITLQRPTGSVAPGGLGRIRYDLAGTEGLDLAVFAYGVANFGPSTTPSILMSSTTLLGTATGGPPPFDDYVAPGSGWLTFTLPATVENSVPYADLVFACTDLVETGLVVAGSADLGLSGSFTQPEATCWEQGGMSLASPASWISGIARMISCVSHELLVPDSAALLDQVQEVNATVADRPPFVAVAAIVGFAGDLSASFSATSGSGCFTGPSIPGVTASSQACAGAGINVEPSQRSTMALLMTAPMILGLAGHMFGLLRGQSEYITEDNGQMAMRL